MVSGSQLVKEYRETIGKFTYDQRDCIYSIWEILKKYGAKADMIGSNWFARHELINLRPLTSRDQLYDGCAVLKTVLPGQRGYALPDRYNNHPVKIDYNHIGLGTDAGEILDSTRYGDKGNGKWERNGPGVSTAPIGPSSWDIIADFEDVKVAPGKQPEFPDIPAGDTNVAVKSGQGLVLISVRLRKTMSKSGEPIKLLSKDAIVTIPDPVITSIDGSDWVWLIHQEGKYTYKGYAVARDKDGTYIQIAPADSGGGIITPAPFPAEAIAEIELAYSALGRALKIMKGA